MRPTTGVHLTTPSESQSAQKAEQQKRQSDSARKPDMASEPKQSGGAITQEEAQRIVADYLDRTVTGRTKMQHLKWSKAVTSKAEKHILEADISPGDILTVIYHEYRTYDELPGGGIGTIGGAIGRKFHIKNGQVVMVTR